MEVDCSNGVDDPILGCSDPEAGLLGGQEYLVIFAGPDTWFSGNSLPSSIPDISSLIGIFGQGQIWAAASQTGSAELGFTTLAVTELSPEVPALSPFALTLLSGLMLALPLFRRAASGLN